MTDLIDERPSGSYRFLVGVLYLVGLAVWLVALLRPVVRIVAPEADGSTDEAAITLRATVLNADVANVALTINDAPVALSERAEVLDLPLQLVPGPNRIVLSASKWWLSDRQERSIRCVPSIGIEDPATGHQTRDRLIRVSGAARNFRGATGSILVQDRRHLLKLDEQGRFEVTVPLVHGTNVIRAQLDLPGEEPVRSSEVQVQCLAQQSDLWVELIWNEDGADVDLYVRQPDGKTAWFREKNAQSGFLDVDVQDGYGPEHYSISRLAGDRVLPGQYRINVHYYNDRLGVGPVHYKLLVLKDEQLFDAREGTIPGANARAAGPNRIRSDTSWATDEVVVDFSRR